MLYFTNSEYIIGVTKMQLLTITSIKFERRILLCQQTKELDLEEFGYLTPGVGTKWVHLSSETTQSGDSWASPNNNVRARLLGSCFRAKQGDTENYETRNRGYLTNFSHFLRFINKLRIYGQKGCQTLIVLDLLVFFISCNLL